MELPDQVHLSDIFLVEEAVESVVVPQLPQVEQEVAVQDVHVVEQPLQEQLTLAVVAAVEEALDPDQQKAEELVDQE